jgi:hypothetical protein
MQSVKHHQNVRGNSFVSMVTVSAQQIPVGIIANVSLVSTNKSTTILYTTTSVVHWLVFFSGGW